MSLNVDALLAEAKAVDVATTSILEKLVALSLKFEAVKEQLTSSEQNYKELQAELSAAKAVAAAGVGPEVQAKIDEVEKTLEAVVAKVEKA
jgi:uncharacterized coiled-coil DUF342 family protein